ncbi:MAG TPA: phosphotransferase [Actinomycetota bacterium]|nr:phosphotransferase [Actinomycetota bacterium]
MPGEHQQPAPPLRETGVAQVMTSTKVDQHPTAFTATGLPILQVALNVKQMTARLAPLLHPLTAANGDGPTPAVSYARLLAYKQGNRGTIHYDVTGLDTTDSGGVGALLGKLYPQPSQAQRVDAILRGLWDQAFADAPGLGVPRPVGCLPELSMLLYVPVEGDSLDEVLAGDDQTASTAAVEQTAGWLATLHRARLLLDRRFSLDTEVVNLQAWAALVARTWPTHGATAARLSADLRASAPALELRAAAPIHKDFQYKHVLVNGGLRVIDFDEVRLGDPTYDAAHFCAHLRLLAWRLRRDPDAFRALESVFLAAYTGGGGELAAAPFSWFAAYTCLKIAKQLCTTRGVRPRPDGEEQRRQVDVMLAQGLAYRDAVA